MRRDLPYVATLALLALVTLPADLAALQALPLGSGMQLLLASGLAGLTALAAHVGARALTDLIDTWPQRQRVPWAFWLDFGQAVVVIGGTVGMLLAFGLLRGDTLGVIGELTGNDELQAAGWKINAALFGLQFVCFVVALVLGIKRLQGLRGARLERDIREIDKRIAEAQCQADAAARTIVAADNTIAKLDRELAREREEIESWAIERHTRTDYQWQKQRIRAEKRRHRLTQRETGALPTQPGGTSEGNTLGRLSHRRAGRCYRRRGRARLPGQRLPLDGSEVIDMRVLRMSIVVIAVSIVAGLLAGCGLSDELTGAAVDQSPTLVTVVVADISASTLGQRDRYVDDVMTATVGTAELDGAVYVSTVDGLASNDAWQLPDRRFSTNIGGGNESLARAARTHQAERLRPEVTRLLQGHGRGGSDLLAMLTNVRRLLCTLPSAERRVVIVSDGGVLAGGVNLYRRPPQTKAARRHLIDLLRRSGEIPRDLGCGTGSPVRVWLSGLGVGIAQRDVAVAARSFYLEALESTGAVVVAEGPQLLERSFGDGAQRHRKPVA